MTDKPLSAEELSQKYIPHDYPDDGGKGQRDLIRRLNGEIRELKAALSATQGVPYGWKAANALRAILPMAKGYAAANRVGRNQKIIEDAERALSELLKAPTAAPDAWQGIDKLKALLMITRATCKGKNLGIENVFFDGTNLADAIDAALNSPKANQDGGK
jgi:hypothetical protein